MSENTATTLTVGTEETETEVTVEDVVGELTTTAFGDKETITAYKIATIINGAFEVLGDTKRIPTQMMYNYDRNGMIVKGTKGKKAFTKNEVTTFVTKYVSKYVK